MVMPLEESGSYVINRSVCLDGRWFAQKRKLRLQVSRQTKFADIVSDYTKFAACIVSQ